MATRGIYKFKDKHNEFRVYKHWDNYPSAAVDFIEAALPYAWPLPRFEADEFACAFITANKKDNGDLRLIPHEITDMGQDYEYTITCPDSNEFGNTECELIIEFDDFKGTLEEMRNHVNKD